MVDIGVGEIPSGPYGCDNCQAVAVAWEDRDSPELDTDEKKFQVWKGRVSKEEEIT
jgi:hypothetical protein